MNCQCLHYALNIRMITVFGCVYHCQQRLHPVFRKLSSICFFASQFSLLFLIPNFLFIGRSHKEKQSCYAPQEGVRYDGVYRIEKCWRKAGKQVEICQENNFTCFYYLKPLTTFLLKYYRDFWSAVIYLFVVIMILRHGQGELFCHYHIICLFHYMYFYLYV